MTTASERFLVDLASEPASWACREAVAKMDWQVETIQPARMTVKRSFGFLNADNVRIEIVLSDEGPDVTAVALKGRLSWGIGRWDKKTLTSWMNTTRNAIEVAANQRRN